MGFFWNKVKLNESGLFKGFTDYHCHILPGVDDGIQTIEESLAILDEYAGAGITDVWLTPHIMEDIPNTPEFLKLRFEELKKAYHGPVSLHLAAEHMLDDLMKDRLSNGEVLPVMERFLLVETSYFNPPIDMGEMLERVKSAGYFPILAHPERYLYMQRKHYEKLHSNGIRFQLNLASLFGYYGKSARAKSQWLLENHYYDFVGTDLHSINLWNSLQQEKIKKSRLELIRK